MLQNDAIEHTSIIDGNFKVHAETRQNSLRQGKEYLKQFYQLFSQILTIKKLLSVFQKYQFANSIILLKGPNN